MTSAFLPSESPKDSSPGIQPKTSRSELRKYLRFRIDDALAKLLVNGFLSLLGLGRASKTRGAINMSEGGVMLLMGENIAVGTEVTIRIEMEKYSDFVESLGEIRWCRQSARCEDEYYVGIAFAGLGSVDQKKIAQMRDWFTSREFKNRAASRRRSQISDVKTWI